MRINESQLRRVIRRLIGEAPLVDLPTGRPAYVRGPDLTTSQKTELSGHIVDMMDSSVGFKRALEFTESAKNIFSNTRDNWAVIMPPYAFLGQGGEDEDGKTYSRTGLLG